MNDMVEVRCDGIQGTARVPRSALKHMEAQGWEPVDPKATDTGHSGDGPGDGGPSDSDTGPGDGNTPTDGKAPAADKKGK